MGIGWVLIGIALARHCTALLETCDGQADCFYFVRTRLVPPELQCGGDFGFRVCLHVRPGAQCLVKPVWNTRRICQSSDGSQSTAEGCEPSQHVSELFDLLEPVQCQDGRPGTTLKFVIYGGHDRCDSGAPKSQTMGTTAMCRPATEAEGSCTGTLGEGAGNACVWEVTTPGICTDTKCNTGQHPFGDVCHEDCQCTNGEPSRRDTCDGEIACASCHTGYHLTSQLLCWKNCYCEHGEQDWGSECNGQQRCSGVCDEGYQFDWNLNLCVVYGHEKCKCDDGEAAARLDCKGEDECVSCWGEGVLNPVTKICEAWEPPIDGEGGKSSHHKGSMPSSISVAVEVALRRIQGAVRLRGDVAETHGFREFLALRPAGCVLLAGLGVYILARRRGRHEHERGLLGEEDVVDPSQDA